MQEDDTHDTHGSRRRVIVMGSDEELTSEIHGHLESILGRVFQFITVDQRQYGRLLDKRAGAEEETTFARVQRFTSSALFRVHPPPIIIVFQDAHDWTKRTEELHGVLQCLALHNKVYFVLAGDNPALDNWGYELNQWGMRNLRPVKAMSYPRDGGIDDAHLLGGLLLLGDHPCPHPLDATAFAPPAVEELPRPRPAWTPFLLYLAAMAVIGVVKIKLSQ